MELACAAQWIGNFSPLLLLKMNKGTIFIASEHWRGQKSKPVQHWYVLFWVVVSLKDSTRVAAKQSAAGLRRRG
eukprot:6013365-Amphidinium_carterae.1